MSTGIWSAASGATAQLMSLDATANNLANANTPGFKGDTTVFREHLMSAVKGGRSVKEMRFSAVDAYAHDYAAGPITQTGRPLDAAINGEGFFTVKTDAGERYTRAGSFSLTQKGELVMAGGGRVMNESGQPITVPPDAQSVRITADGSVDADGSTVGRLKVVKFVNQAALEKEGNILFKTTESSGKPKVIPAQLETESVEGANTSVVQGMTSMVTTTRTFDAIERVIDAFSQADKLAASQVGKV
ncbi:MAG TPA: flagellar basal-body rod protein FlgF [Polyangiaceae bacterium]|jgi:flagellar basal-body rod protein FlgF|nr:flagellar basal-body rod protein FlgF [Polyangiaceae bacterium]